MGLEAALVDHAPIAITALDPSDRRSITTNVAGLPALLVAKIHKINDRLEGGKPSRLSDKDAADIYRIMQTAPAEHIGAALRILRNDPIAGEVTEHAITLLHEYFGNRRGRAIEMAQRSLELAIPPEQVSAVAIAFIAALLSHLG